MSKDLPVEIPVFVVVCVCLCICIFLDPACRILYQNPFVISFSKIYHIIGVSGSPFICLCCYLVVLDQYAAVVVGTWWYWVRTGQYWLPM